MATITQTHTSQDTSMATIPSSTERDDKAKDLLNALLPQVVTFKNETKPFSQLDHFQQYQYIRQRQIVLGEIEDKNNTNIKLLNAEEERATAGGVPMSQEMATYLATARGELQRTVQGAMEVAGIHWDHLTMSTMLVVLAPKAAAPLEIHLNELNGKGFQIRFVECPLIELTAATKRKICNTLQYAYGAVDQNTVNLNTKTQELWVSFVSHEAKNKCVEGGAKTFGWGVPTAHISPAFIESAYSVNTLFLSELMEGTTEGEISLSFAALGAAPASCKIHRDMAFVNYGTENDLFNALRIQRIKIKDRTINISAAKQSDPDELKGILGFWSETRTTHLGALYSALNSHVWDFLYVQPVFWDNGGLKHYYFIKFPSVKAKEDAMFTPVIVEGNILQVYPVNRDETGRLRFPAEGAWKKRKTGSAEQQEVQQNVQRQANSQIAQRASSQYVPIIVRSFD